MMVYFIVFKFLLNRGGGEFYGVSSCWADSLVMV